MEWLRNKRIVFGIIALVVVFLVAAMVIQQTTETPVTPTRDKPLEAQEQTQSSNRATSSQAARISASESGKDWHIPTFGMAFAYVAPGSFQMGSNDGDSDEKPVHKVRISQGYWIGKYEVTQQQYQSIMGNNPSISRGTSKPVVYRSVSRTTISLCEKTN